MSKVLAVGARRLPRYLVGEPRDLTDQRNPSTTIVLDDADGVARITMEVGKDDFSFHRYQKR